MASAFLQLVLSASYLFSAPPAGLAHCEAFALPVGVSSSGVRLIHKEYFELNSTLAFKSGNGELNTRNEVPFCRLELEIVTNAPTNHSARTELWLPDDWNSRLLGVGNGGWSGGAVYPNLYHDGLLSSFATFSTNTGHDSGALDASWALDNPERILDFSHRAVHLSTVASKAIAGAYYRKRAERIRSYWLGCSTGGAQGLKAAQTYPADFDAIIVGSPAAWMTRLQAWAVHQHQSISPARMSPKLWAVVHAEVLKQCDALDGVTDGVLEDPRMCFFRPETLACRPGKTKSCLDRTQIEAIKKVYSHYYAPDGSLLFTRTEPGNELAYREGGVLGPQPIAFPLEYFRYIVLNDTEWHHDALTHDIVAAADSLDVGGLNAVNPNLLEFTRRGGKVVHYFGWGDQNISPQDSIRYFDSVTEFTLSHSTYDPSSFYRLLPVPGMSHCHSGAGATAFGGATQASEGMPPLGRNATFDIVQAAVQWREKGKPVDEVTAVRWDGKGKVEKSRKLCAFPKRAVYVGAGKSANEASSFKCV